MDPLFKERCTLSREEGRGAGRSINSILEINDITYGDQSDLWSESMTQRERYVSFMLPKSPTPSCLAGEPRLLSVHCPTLHWCHWELMPALSPLLGGV